MRRRSLARVAVPLLGSLLLAAAGQAGPAEPDPHEETQRREVFVPHPEFRSYPDRDQLTVEGVSFLLVRRLDQSEVLVTREDTGWEQVILEGEGRLTFYSLARQPLRRTAGRHVVVQDWSGGAHCCSDYHVFHVQGVRVRREGMVRAGDCDLRVADLDQDGSLELIACDARFAYAFDLPFAESPLVPLVYTFRDRDRMYVADNRRFPQVFRYRVAQERRRLAEAEQAGDGTGARRAVIGLLLHMLYAGRVAEGWCTFDRRYRWEDRAAVRQEVLERLRRPPDPEDLRLPLVDVGYTLSPDRC